MKNEDSRSLSRLYKERKLCSQVPRQLNYEENTSITEENRKI